MRKVWLYLLPLLLTLACVGQKEDPDEFPEDPGNGQEIPGGADEGEEFFHRTLALCFTATWCQYCPNMEAAVEEVSELRPGRIVPVAIHQYDEISPKEADDIVARFKVSGFPSLVFDLDPDTKSNGQSVPFILEYVDGLGKEGVCGIALSSSLDGSKLAVKVSVKPVHAGRYSVAAALVEDGILVKQTGAGENYACNSVLRRLFDGGLDGRDLGELGSGKESSCVFEEEIKETNAKLRVVAYVLEGGRVVNAVSCGLNKSIDYLYEED